MCNQDNEDSLHELETLIGYTFADRQLLATALTSPSYRAEPGQESAKDNQRLEFFGDAVFGLLAAEHVFTRYADEAEGSLTVRRSRMVSGKALADLARGIGLGKYLRMRKHDEANGGRDKDRFLTEAMEALFGGVWRDGGLDAAQTVFARLTAACPQKPLDQWADNPKGQLQELAQRHAWPDSPTYTLLDCKGPDHAPEYTVQASVLGGHAAVGSGKTKREAEAAAASALLRLLHTTTPAETQP